MAATAVERFAGVPVLVVRRFDRRTLDDGTVVRIHGEDGCQALGVHPGRKYQADGGPSVEDLARVIRANTGSVAHESVVAYSLLSGRQVRLAPLYDVASTAPHFRPRKLKLAQKVGGEHRADQIGRRHWERLARAVRIDAAQLVDDVAAMADALPDALADAAAALPPVDRTRGAELRDALVPWVADCPGRPHRPRRRRLNRVR